MNHDRTAVRTCKRISRLPQTFQQREHFIFMQMMIGFDRTFARHQNRSIFAKFGNIRLFSDESKLKQILINLIGNAIKFTPKYGVLGLIVEKESLSDWIKFIVWDNGIGIASEHLDVVFEPFVQIDSELSRSEKGTGLGLTLAKGLARLLGGEIAVESTLQAGSRFTLRIPCAADLTRQPPLPEGTMPLTQGSSE